MSTEQSYVGKGETTTQFPPKAKNKANSLSSVDNRSIIPPLIDSHSGDESWQPLPGFEDRYEISSFGRITSVHTGLIMQTIVDQHGYECLQIKRSNSQKKLHLCVHWVVAAAFLDNPRGLPVIRWKDGNCLNNRADNLEYAPTPATDSIDQFTSPTPSSHD